MNAHIATIRRLLRNSIASMMVIVLLAGCNTPQRMSDAKLESLGVRLGAPHWEATASLAREGYSCGVSGEKRESFECAKTTGFFVSCIFRVRFKVDDSNRISELGVPEPACIGTP